MRWILSQIKGVVRAGSAILGREGFGGYRSRDGKSSFIRGHRSLNRMNFLERLATRTQSQLRETLTHCVFVLVCDPVKSGASTVGSSSAKRIPK
jgi:hypothetical protein